MTDTTATHKARPVFRNIHVTQIVKYRLPPAGIVSIGHRISGVMMFLLLPFVVWLFDVTLTSEVSYGLFTSAYTAGLWIFPAWIVKLGTLALIWAYLHHFIAGIRHLLMDLHLGMELRPARQSAAFTLVLSLLLTLAVAVKLW